MTVNEYVLDRYVGKTIQFYVQEFKYQDGEIVRRARVEVSPYKPYRCDEWELAEYETEKIGKNVYWRNVLIKDKIVETKPSRYGWNFKTLTGYHFNFTIHTELETL